MQIQPQTAEEAKSLSKTESCDRNSQPAGILQLTEISTFDKD